MLTSDSQTKMTKFLQNCWGATSFWLSTSVWESLLNAKEFYFSSCFCMNLTWASHTHEEKSMFLIILKRFLSFLTMRTHAQACDCWPKYTTSRLNLTTSRGGLVCLFVTQIQVEWARHTVDRIPLGTAIIYIRLNLWIKRRYRPAVYIGLQTCVIWSAHNMSEYRGVDAVHESCPQRPTIEM